MATPHPSTGPGTYGELDQNVPPGGRPSKIDQDTLDLYGNAAGNSGVPMSAWDGTQWSHAWDTSDPNRLAGAGIHTDERSYMYGRDPNAANAAVGGTQQVGQMAINSGYGAQQAGAGAAQGGLDLANQRTNDATYFNQRQTGLPMAQQLAGLEQQQGPSAAQAQLQGGTNQAMAGQLALARSGRGFGGGAASAGLAQTNMAGLQAGQANQSAMLRAQEDAAWRSRQASNLGNANQQILASQGQNDAMAGQMLGLAQQGYFQGQGLQQQGYQNQMQGYQTNLQGQQLANQIRGQEMSGGLQMNDDAIRQWAAQNGLTLAGQQRQDQQQNALIGAGAAVLGAIA